MNYIIRPIQLYQPLFWPGERCSTGSQTPDLDIEAQIGRLVADEELERNGIVILKDIFNLEVTLDKHLPHAV